MVQFSRRSLLLGMPALAMSARIRTAFAMAPTDRRFVVVLLRGAMDGLSAVVPYGSPQLADLRGGLLLPEPSQPKGLLDLGGQFGLHPALAGMHGMYADGDLLIWHGRLMHRGSAPTGNRWRPALIAHYSGVNHRPDMTTRARTPAGHEYFLTGIPLQ